MSENRKNKSVDFAVQNGIDAFQNAVLAVSGVEKAKNSWLARRHTIMNTYDDDGRLNKTDDQNKENSAGDDELDVKVREMVCIADWQSVITIDTILTTWYKARGPLSEIMWKSFMFDPPIISIELVSYLMTLYLL